MVGSNTETGITVTYEDGDNTLDFAIGSITSLGSKSFLLETYILFYTILK